MERLAIIAITKKWIEITKSLKNQNPQWDVFAPSKFSNNDPKVNWFEDTTTSKVGDLFQKYEALVCIFSLGAVIRLVSPHIKLKKTDPAVIEIHDTAKFVITT